MADEKNTWRTVRSFRASDEEWKEMLELREQLGLSSMGEVVRALAREKLSVLRMRSKLFSDGGVGRFMISEQMAIRVHIAPKK